VTLEIQLTRELPWPNLRGPDWPVKMLS